jgi:N-formylglutamate amidohydrolase
MNDHQVILGTRHDATCAPELADAVAAVFTAHGFAVARNVRGYAGGNIVATFGRPRTGSVHALQLEINAALLITTPREELVARVSRGEMPERAEGTIARIRACLGEVLAALPAALATIPAV